MYAAIHLPDLPLHALLSDGEISLLLPTALLSDGDREKARILALNQAALSHGLTHGMSALAAMARCPDLFFLTRDPDIEASMGRFLLSFAESLTPDFESTTADTILLDLSTLILPSTTEWTRLTLEKAIPLRVPVHIGTAHTPDLAHLYALSAQTASTLDPPAQVRLLDGPPSLHTLSIDQLTRCPAFSMIRSHEEILTLWGIRTLGDLAALPRQGLSERLGPPLAWLHDVLHGKEHRLLQLHRPLPKYQGNHDFESPVDHFEPILFIARRLLQTLTNRLRNQQRAASALVLSLRYENGLSHRQRLTLSEPTLEPETLIRALHTHLDSIRAPAPITRFSLKLIPALPSHKQHDIFRQGLRDPNRFHDTLHQLTSLVGSKRLGIPQLDDTHRPDRFHLHPISPDFLEIRSPDIPPATHLPMSRFRPPINIQVISEMHHRFSRPLAILTGPYRGNILQTAGPYPLSGNWWDHTWQQIQWDVQIPDHLLQLTHIPPDTWQLTGIYS